MHKDTAAMGFNPRSVNPGTGNVELQLNNGLDNDLETELDFLNDKELELFLRQLAKMLEASITLERAINIIATGDAQLHRTLVAREILIELRGGKAFSEILGNYLTPQNNILTALLKSGEMSGNLANSVTEMEKLIITRNQTAQKIQSSMVYPAILAIISIISLNMILFYVIPQFSSLLGQGSHSLPASAKFVFWLSDTVRAWWWLICFLFLIILYKTYITFRNGGMFNLVNHAFGIIPGFKELPDKIQTSIVCRLLGTLLSNGVKFVSSLEVAKEATSDEAFFDGMEEIIDAVSSGKTAEKAFADTELFSRNLLQMIKIGEETGDLGGMFSRSADILDDEIESKIKRFIILFEPSILLLIGILIGGLLYGLFSAILSVNSIAF